MVYMSILFFLLTGCSTTQELTFNYDNKTYTSKDFSQVNGGYQVNSAETSMSWKTAGVKYTAWPTINNVFIPENQANLRSYTDWDFNSAWLIVPLGAGFVVFVLWGTGAINF
jgi:hypothetical protein